MTEDSAYVAGTGPLTYPRVLREAWGMFRQHYRRVALVAVLLFVPPQLVVAGLGAIRLDLETDPDLLRGLGYVIGLLMVTLVRLLGPVVFAGYLDEAVGHEYFRGRRTSLSTVLRTLPWGRLLGADLILVIGTVVGLAAFILPGLIWLTLLGLVGPVIVQERRGLLDGFGRTLEISRRATRMIFLLVVVTLAVESLAHELVHQSFHHGSFLLEVTASWLVSAVIGGIVGLLEVALATELMARTPRPPSTTG